MTHFPSLFFYMAGIGDTCYNQIIRRIIIIPHFTTIIIIDGIRIRYHYYHHSLALKKNTFKSLHTSTRYIEQDANNTA